MNELITLTRRRRELLTTLANIPYFEGLPESELLFLVRQGYPQSVSQLQYVCREGDVANSFYIILEGKVEVISLSKKKHISVLHSGDFFGEIALFTGSPRLATCRTIENSKFFVIHREHLRTVLTNHRDTAERIALKLLDRQNNLISLGVLDFENSAEQDNLLNLIRSRLQHLFKN